MESEFPSNSQGPRAGRRPTPPEPKQIKRVTQGEVVRRKKPLGKRFIEFFGFGSIKEAATTVVQDVLIPAAKEMAVDGFRDFGESVVYRDGEGRRGRGRDRGRGGSYIDYQRRYSSGGGRSSKDRDEPRSMSRKSRTTHDFDDIILDSRAEAEEVIDQLFELVSKYEMATVSDLYEMVGVKADFPDEKWGWTDIRGAGITRIRNGWLLDLPRPEHLA